MKLSRPVIREMGFRRLGTLLAVLSVALATGVGVATFTFFRAYDMMTEEALEAKRKAVEEANAEMADEYRKITKGLGFNILILPKDQELSDLYADDFASKYMPEEYAQRLADSRVMSVRHLLPSLQHKLVWPERRRTIIVMGVRGEVPLLHRNPRRPIMDAVSKGSIIMGHELCTSLGLSPGDTVTLKGKRFEISKCHERRGNRDDVTVWIHLAEAQEMFDKEGLINAILALECRCVADGTLPNIAKIRDDLARMLPETQVIEFMSKALTRAEARYRAATAAEEALETEELHRQTLRAEREKLAGLVTPFTIALCFVLLILLGIDNTRKRRIELSVLRAIGVRRNRVMGLLFMRALIVGLVGASLGWLLGVASVGLWTRGVMGSFRVLELIRPAVLVGAITGAPILTVIAGWIPALIAIQQDPANILREE
ncbi:MAG: FtsX-like permease family protein [Chitinivibrionales bacterium]|nr:FtsX-like permease family protein [Chitinivibrionales bacterium]